MINRYCEKIEKALELGSCVVNEFGCYDADIFPTNHQTLHSLVHNVLI